jgi:hypothetical protein
MIHSVNLLDRQVHEALAENSGRQRFRSCATAARCNILYNRSGWKRAESRRVAGEFALKFGWLSSPRTAT